MFNWRLQQVTFSGGQTVTPGQGAVTLIIGPNSSGKSAALRTIIDLLRNGSPGPVVTDASVSRTGTFADCQQWFESNYPVRTMGGVDLYVTRPDSSIRTDMLEQAWNGGDRMLDVAGFLSTSLDTASRTTLVNYVASIDVWEQVPNAYVHVLQADDELLRTVNKEVKAAFGRVLVIDWMAGQRVGFRIGESEPPRTSADDRVSEAYAANLRRLPALDGDGDGIKSFVGSLLAAYCGSQPLLMIDEPEAFLHPPQARRLAAALTIAAKEKGRQVIMATHSADIVQGALNADGDVTVCRLTRVDDRNHAAVLAAGDLKGLWSKPLLRSAAAISGLFHTGVVVCEADADVRLYETALRRAESAGRVPTADVFFTQGGGKGELATLASAYRSLNTRAAVIADIDLIRNAAEHRNVLTALGSSLDTTDSRYRSVVAALGDAPPLKSVSAAASEIREAVDRFEADGEVSGKHKETISRALQMSSKFSEAKRYGIEKLRGPVLAQAKNLLEEWRAVGLFLVPVGELESWWPDGPANDKGAWIRGVVTELAKPDTLVDLDKFVLDVAAYLSAV